MRVVSLFAFVSIAVLTSSGARGAVTFDDNFSDSVQRPVKVTGLNVNSVSYDVTIAYNIPINRVTPVLIGELPNSDANLAAFALRDAINAAAVAIGTDSQESIIYLLSNTQPASGSDALSLASINDSGQGIGDFVALLSDDDDVFSAPRNARGVFSFTLATMSESNVPEPSAVPELSSTVIGMTIALSAALRRRRRGTTCRSA